MIGKTSILEKSTKAGAAITAFTIAKFGGDDETMVPAAGNTDELIGIFQHGAENGKEVRVMLGGISRLKLGGTVARGNYVTSDGSGNGVAIGSTGGTNYTVIGKALASGVSGDIIPVLIAPSRPQG